MSVNEKMTALADEIRELSGTTTAKSIDAMTSDVDAANTEIVAQTELLEQLASALEEKVSGITIDASSFSPNLSNNTTLLELLLEKINALPEEDGITIREWVSGTTYNVGDIVIYMSAYYICIATVGGLDYPQVNSPYWELLNTDVIGGYKGEYSASETYRVNDIVTENGNVYRCINSVSGNSPSNSLGMYWEQLNESGGISMQVIPAGTYYLQNVYPSSYSLHPYYFTISERISGTYTDTYGGNSGIYDTITIGGHDGSDEMPVSSVTLKSGDIAVGVWDGYYMSSYSPYLTISNDTEVSSLFYDVFMGLTQY